MSCNKREERVSESQEGTVVYCTSGPKKVECSSFMYAQRLFFVVSSFTAQMQASPILDSLLRMKIQKKTPDWTVL
jgi:hypothetical protein